MVVRYFRKPSRLAAMIDQPGGATVGRLMSQVEANLETLRPEAMAKIEQAIAELEGLTAARSSDQAAWLADIYHRAGAVLDMAGPFGFDALGKVAFSLCDLADRFGAAGEFDLASLQVHVRAARLLFANPDLSEDGRQEVLRGLDRVLGRVPRSE